MTISIEEARKLIKGNKKYSDEEIERMIHDLQLLAELLYDHWQDERRGKKLNNPTSEI